MIHPTLRDTSLKSVGLRKTVLYVKDSPFFFVLGFFFCFTYVSFDDYILSKIPSVVTFRSPDLTGGPVRDRVTGHGPTARWSRENSVRGNRGSQDTRCLPTLSSSRTSHRRGPVGFRPDATFIVS